MDRPLDENLPEVVPDFSPQALSKDAAAQHLDQFTERDPKYPVILDDTPKLAKEDDGSPVVAPAAAVSPETTLPWEPQSATDQGRTPIEPPSGAGDGEEGGKIFGMKRRTFWIVLITAIVVLAIALGGGLGGGLANRDNGNPADAEGALDG